MLCASYNKILSKQRLSVIKGRDGRYLEDNASLFQLLLKRWFLMHICLQTNNLFTVICPRNLTSPPPPLPPSCGCAQGRCCVQPLIPLTPCKSFSLQDLQVVVVNSCFYWAERGESLAGVRVRVLLCFLHFLLPSPLSSEGLDAVTPH